MRGWGRCEKSSTRHGQKRSNGPIQENCWMLLYPRSRRSGETSRTPWEHHHDPTIAATKTRVVRKKRNHLRKHPGAPHRPHWKPLPVKRRIPRKGVCSSSPFPLADGSILIQPFGLPLPAVFLKAHPPSPTTISTIILIMVVHPVVSHSTGYFFVFPVFLLKLGKMRIKTLVLVLGVIRRSMEMSVRSGYYEHAFKAS
ncbi:unnamed protein product [Trypanosoma congolense IL3000]|uniref:WGS project CAEQ00000000 data, annotated contig 81 n=1 Tax=Trypanosoma congolense (strain IL3000) TaxID=1068625 RepID=F9WIN9_TRYCI|nr:unnamed protein product [Trypanosoma congolense IL3000]